MSRIHRPALPGGGPGGRVLDRRAALRLAGLSAMAFALGGCRGSESEAPACPIEPLDASAATVADGFARPDGPIGTAGTGQTWEEDAGAWTIRSGRAVATPRFRQEVCTAVVDTGAANGLLEVMLTLSPTNRRANAGVVFRCADADNNLFVKLERTPVNPGGMLAIGKKQGRAVTYFASRTSDIDFDNGDTVRVLLDFEGPHVRVRVSTCETVGHTLNPADMDRYGGLTRHGLRVNTAPDDDDGRSSFGDFRFGPSV